MVDQLGTILIEYQNYLFWYLNLLGSHTCSSGPGQLVK
eukprot:SAG11_NODE_7148_length_1186_cov_3.028519_2_plen_37_part_01